MNLRIIRNITKQGFEGMWRNRSMGLASVGSITAVLIILGMVLIMVLSINNMVLKTSDKFDEMQVLLDDGLDEEAIEKVKTDIEAIESVDKVSFYCKDEALEEMKKDFEEKSGKGYLLEGLEKNPLQDSYIVKLGDIKDADEVVMKIRDIEGVEDVDYSRDVIDKLVLFTNYLQVGGLGIIVVLILISIFIISNTIKVTVSARKREINIMKYVGATNGYIRGPFIIEGVLFGLIGALISIFVINYGYKGIFKFLSSESIYSLVSTYLISPKELISDISVIFISIGMGIGALGSLVSLKRFLNV